jgi:hypothetical protein
MKLRFRHQSPNRTAAVALLLAAGTTAHAAKPQKDLYVDVYGGLSILGSGDVIRSGTTTKGSYDRGLLSGAAFGKQVSPAWALEVEWFYRSNEVKSMNGGSLNGVNDGDFASCSTPSTPSAKAGPLAPASHRTSALVSASCRRSTST